MVKRYNLTINDRVLFIDRARNAVFAYRIDSVDEAGIFTAYYFKTVKKLNKRDGDKMIYLPAVSIQFKAMNVDTGIHNKKYSAVFTTAEKCKQYMKENNIL